MTTYLLVVILRFMASKTNNQRIIFGLKVRQYRQAEQLSFAELSKRSGLSVSYLNEIEKGKKYPKEEKIHALSEALAVPYQELISQNLSPTLAPVSELLKSNFLKDLPLDLFGIELSKVVEIIANAPARVNAFISTLLELSRNYALNEENFYFGALRSYLQLHNNYFEELEEEVKRFEKAHDIPTERPVQTETLARILQADYRYEIIHGGLDAHEELNGLRSLYLPGQNRLLTNSRLTAMQERFQLGKELAFHFMELKERAITSSIVTARSFEEVLNHSKAIYFSVALLMPLEAIRRDLNDFFRLEHWQGDAFLDIMRKYDATPEMFYHRLTNVLPEFFGIRKLFFVRFVHDAHTGRYEVDRELHLNRAHHPHSNGLNEHYCRRWVATSLIRSLHELQKEGNFVHTIIRAQRAQYLGTNDEYLCFTIARPADSKARRNVSVTLGMLLDENLKKGIKFVDDPAIEKRSVNITCERCALSDCGERAAAPKVIEKRAKKMRIQQKLDDLRTPQ